MVNLQQKKTKCREKCVESNSGTEVVEGGEKQTALQPPWNGNNSSIINMLTLWKQLFIFLGRFSASKLLATVVAMEADFVDHKYVV